MSKNVSWKELIEAQNDEIVGEIEDSLLDDSFISELIYEVACGNDESVMNTINTYFDDAVLNDIAKEIIERDNECPLCHGSGGIPEYPCMQCHGSGKINKRAWA